MEKLPTEQVNHLELKQAPFQSIIKGLLEQENDLAVAREKVRVREIEVEDGMKTVREFFRDKSLKDLELGLLQDQILERQSVLALKEKELGDIDERISGKAAELGVVTKSVEELVRKKNEVEEIVKSISDCACQLQLKQKELNEVKGIIRDCKSGEWRLAELQEKSRRCCEELQVKEEELSGVKTCIEECFKELSLKKEELERKEKQLQSLEESIRSCTSKFHFEDNKYKEELKSKANWLDCVQEKVETSLKNLELKQTELAAIQSSIDTGRKYFTVREKLIGILESRISKRQLEVEEMEEQKLSMQILIKVFAQSLESGDKSLCVVEEHICKCIAKLESRLGQLSLIQSKLLGWQQRLKSKEQDLDSKQKLLEKHNAEVEEKEKQLSSIATDFQPSCDASVESSTDDQGGNGGSLQSLLNEHLRRHDLLLSKVWTALLKSPDPAKLVLDAMSGFYPKESSGEYDLSVIRKSCITLLELLYRIFPQIKPQVSKESMELARAWKSKLGTAASNSLQVLGLVKLVSAFRLPSAFKAYGFHSLHKDVNSNMNVDVNEEWKALSFAENLVGSYILPQTVTLDQNPIHRSSEEIVSITSPYEGGFPQLLLQDEPLSSELSSNVLTTALRHSKDPANMVFRMIQNSFVQHGSNRIKPHDRSVTKHHFLLLQQLMSVSPTVSSHVREAARNLAVTWRASLRQEMMDILVFLLFLATYGLATHFEEDDILKLAEKITQHAKGPELWSDLGLKVKVPGLIKSLIEKDMYIEAARFSCSFRLVDDYPPHIFLLKFLEKSKTFERGRLLLESQRQAFNSHLEHLKHLIQLMQELEFDRSLVNSKIVEHFKDLSRQLELKQNCLLVAAGTIQPQRQAELDQDGATNTIPSYKTNPSDQTSTAAENPSAFSQQQHMYNWPWQGGSLTHRAKRNKRPRIDEQWNSGVEESAMQQQIVDIYTRSMQQFTESLAKMKLPVDMDKPGVDDDVLIQGFHGNSNDHSWDDNDRQQQRKKKKDGSRVL
ncbi:FRIGIDA-like protein 5 [Linum perenne]